ncbi:MULTISPECIES: MFS transporter [Virgibacillus]|jgi:MFS family permease|uniref:MFS transporter n=1 Tax=Virgibacillus TaxID=84406 RepID=UPI00045D249B|nr:MULTISPECIES: MFS transporter [Virgibacillus]AIF44766.1 MFS transporter [Virgibacillus sp. SK37]MCG1029156.1 MFS transporter [Virgibacillus halodenitrificans]MCJ0932765.1 MFS transporter [Virgibacillus halodenitrificans]MEC2157912.1 MFS transporter [Virgibacillus halodenitrificans]MYL57261.1 MFS transporter [Virgibacillus halodenitrificans]
MSSQAVNHRATDKIWTKDFVLVCLANFFIFLGFQMTLPTLPLFIKELGGSDQMIGIIIGIFTFSALLFRPYAGHALESKGRKFVYMIGLAVFVISVGSYAFIVGIGLLVVMRIVQGAGWGLSTTATSTIATDIIPMKRRGEGLGYFGLSGNLALAFGPALGLTLVGVISFTSLFLICAGLGLVAFLLSMTIHYKKVEESPDKAVTIKFDIFEKSAIQPSILLFFITVTFGGIASFLPLYAAQEHIDGIELYFLVYAAFLMISRTFAGKIYDNKGHLYVFLPGAICIFIAMLLLSWLPNMMVMLVAAAIYGLGFGSVQPALQAWAVDKSPNNRKGMANATFFSFFDLGVGIGAMTFGQLASLSGYGAIYVTAAGSVLIAMLFYVYLILKSGIRNHL